MMPPPILMAGPALLGACVGSFISTAVVRSGRGEPFLVGRSHCDACGCALGFAQTIPVLSYVALRGTCASCRSPIGRMHPIAEAAGTIIAVVATLQPSLAQGTLVILLGSALLTTSLIDARTQILPDALTLVIAAVALSLSLLIGQDQLWIGLSAATTVFVVLEIVRRTYLLRRGIGGLGFGDVKLMAALALWLGLRTPWALAAASLAGLAGFAVLRPASPRLAFGPYIAAAAFLVGTAGSLPRWLA